MTFSLPLSNSRGELSKLYCGARPRISPSVTTASWVVTQYDCNRNGNRAEMLRVLCTVRPLSLLLLEGVRAVFLPISLAQMFLAGCWLGSYFFLEDCESWRRGGKTGFLQMKPGIVVGMPNQLLNARSSFSRIAREGGKTGYFQMKLSSAYIK